MGPMAMKIFLVLILMRLSDSHLLLRCLELEVLVRSSFGF